MNRPFTAILASRLSEKPRFLQILLGPRQVGKTTGVLQLEKLLPEHNIIYQAADQTFSSRELWLREVWQAARQSKKIKTVLIVDEIQVVPGWSQIVKSLWDQDKKTGELFHVVLLGSSSLELHQGLSESLAGRFELTPVYHWSFEETATLVPGLSLDDYLLWGGYPATFELEDLNRRGEYLKNSILETVLTKDILQNVTVKKPALFRQAFEIACSHGGEILSYNKILGQLQEGGNIDLVKYYLSLFRGAFLLETLEKFSTNRLQKKSSSPKLIPLAPCFLPLFGQEERGRMFEVAVGQHLLRMGLRLFYWREGNHEVDYILSHGRKILALEVKSGKARERAGLGAFVKKFPGAETFLVTPENFKQLKALTSAFLGSRNRV